MLKFLVGSVTQGSADAFVQGSINTGLANVSRQAFRIRRIEIQFPGLAGADSNVELAITRKSLSAIPNLTDHSVIRMQRRVCELTTSGMIVYDTIFDTTYSKDEDLVIVEDPIYFQLDSAGTSGSNTAYLRIGYEERTISEVERLAIIAASLA